MFENVDWNAVAYGGLMFGLGFLAATVIQFRRVGLFIKRLQENLGDRSTYKMRVSRLSTLRVMIFGVPKRKSR